MKVRDISLMATGAIAAIAAVVFASSFFNPTQAKAQAAAAAPGAAAITVTVNPTSMTGNTPAQTSGFAVFTQGGLITIHDSANKKVTIVAYESSCYNIGSGAPVPPIVSLSTNVSFTY